MATKRLQNQTTTVDRATGEVVEISKTYSIKTNGSDNFYMVYIDHMAGLFKLSRPVDKDVLSLLCAMSEYNTGKVMLTTAGRQKIMEQLGKPGKPMSTSQLSNSLKRLVDLKLIEGTKGDYMLNPMIHWKGTNDARQRVLTEMRERTGNGGLSVNINFDFEPTPENPK